MCEAPVTLGADLVNCWRRKKQLSLHAFQTKNVEISLESLACDSVKKTEDQYGNFNVDVSVRNLCWPGTECSTFTWLSSRHLGHRVNANMLAFISGEVGD